MGWGGEGWKKGELEQQFGVDEDDEFLSFFIERKLYIFRFICCWVFFHLFLYIGGVTVWVLFL